MFRSVCWLWPTEGTVDPTNRGQWTHTTSSHVTTFVIVFYTNVINNNGIQTKFKKSLQFDKKIFFSFNLQLWNFPLWNFFNFLKLNVYLSIEIKINIKKKIIGAYIIWIIRFPLKIITTSIKYQLIIMFLMILCVF